MPESVTPQEIGERYVELLAGSSLEVINAIHEAAEAEHKLSKARNDPALSAESVSKAARDFREFEKAMEQKIRDHIRLDQQFMGFQETRIG